VAHKPKQHGTLAWNTGHPRYEHGKSTYVFDRENGPFGLISPRGSAIWKVCVRKLGEGETVNNIDERLRIDRYLQPLKKPEVAELTGRPVLRVGRSKHILFLKYLCEAGIPPTMPEDFEQLCHHHPPGQWSAKHRFDIHSGLAFTPDGELAALDGSKHLGQMTYRFNQQLAARHKAMAQLNRDGTPRNIEGWTDQMQAHLDWLLDHRHASPDERRAQAERLAVPVNTLKRWEGHPEFRAKLSEAVTAFLSDPLLVHDIATTLRTAAADGDVASAKMLLDLKEKMIPFKPAVMEDQDSTIAHLTEEERERILAESGVTFSEIVTGLPSE